MPDTKPIPPEDHTKAILAKLVEHGWIEFSLVHDGSGKYVFKWTAKGLQRAAWVKAVGDELNLGPQGFCALLVFCEQHAKDLPPP